MTVIDPLDRTTTYAYDSSGNVTTITQADGSSETIIYNDSFGIPTHDLRFQRQRTTYTLDSHGNITQRTDPDGQSENYTYNSAGQMLTDTDPLGETTTYATTAWATLTGSSSPGRRSRPSSTATILPAT